MGGSPSSMSTSAFAILNAPSGNGRSVLSVAARLVMTPSSLLSYMAGDSSPFPVQQLLFAFPSSPLSFSAYPILRTIWRLPQMDGMSMVFVLVS